MECVLFKHHTAVISRQYQTWENKMWVKSVWLAPYPFLLSYFWAYLTTTITIPFIRSHLEVLTIKANGFQPQCTSELPETPLKKNLFLRFKGLKTQTLLARLWRKTLSNISGRNIKTHANHYGGELPISINWPRNTTLIICPKI